MQEYSSDQGNNPAMIILRSTLCAVFMVTAAMSKPVYLSEGGESSKSSESSEYNSSEEAAARAEPSQDPLQTTFTGTSIPNAIEETAPGPSPATFNTSALPDPEDPETSTDTSTLQLMPDDPAQTDIGIDISYDMPDPDPAQNLNPADTVHVLPDNDVSPHPGKTEPDILMGFGGTTQPQVTTTYQGLSQGATPPFPPHIKPTLPPFSTTPALPIPIVATLNSVPVCFTLLFGTREPDPPRGDSI